MARRVEASLWMLIKQRDKSRCVSVSKVGTGRFVTNIERPFEPGAVLSPLHPRRKAQVGVRRPVFGPGA
jgi:hypothetical protein